MCGCQTWAEEGTALLETAAGQGHAYAMLRLAQIHYARKEPEQALAWNTKAAEAGLPGAMYNLGGTLECDQGMLDYPAAAEWYRRAAAAGHASSAFNLRTMYYVGRGGAALDSRACHVIIHNLVQSLDY